MDKFPKQMKISGRHPKKICGIKRQEVFLPHGTTTMVDSRDIFRRNVQFANIVRKSDIPTKTAEKGTKTQKKNVAQNVK